MCVLWEHHRSAYSAISDDPTGGSGAVAGNRSGHAATPSRAQSNGLGIYPILLTAWDSDFEIRDWSGSIHES
jgi:hypothetical protein